MQGTIVGSGAGGGASGGDVGLAVCFNRGELEHYAWTWVDHWIKPLTTYDLPHPIQQLLSTRMQSTLDTIPRARCGEGEVFINTHRQEQYEGLIAAAQLVANAVVWGGNIPA